MAKTKGKKNAGRNNIFIGAIALIAILALIYALMTNEIGTSNNGNTETTTSETTETTSSTGGYCKSNSECFVTSCRGQSQDCINAVQMSNYAKENCKAYSDWNYVKQDSSKCACIQNACTMK